MAASPLSLMVGNDPETYRQKLALMLAQGGLDASPIRSPWQGATRMAQAILAGSQFKGMRDEDNKYSDIIDKLPGMGGPSTATPSTDTAPSPAMPSATPVQPPSPSSGGPIDRMASISAAGETGNPNIDAKLGQIANDTGGSKSYGPFGLNSWAKGGDVGATSIGKFQQAYGGPLGLTATPGTPEFDAQWKAAAAGNPDALKAANMDWHQKNIASGVTPKLGQIGVPQEMASDPRVQGYFADRSVQYGPASTEKHAARVAQALSGANGDVPAFIRGMSAADRQNIPGDFRTYLATNPNNMPGLNNRISTRERMAMELNGGQLPINAQPTAGAFPSGPFGDVSGLGGNAPPQMTPWMPPPNMAQMQPPQQAAPPPQAAPTQGMAPPVGAVTPQAVPRVAQQATGPARTPISIPPEIQQSIRAFGKMGREGVGKALELHSQFAKPSDQYDLVNDQSGNPIGQKSRLTGEVKPYPQGEKSQRDLEYAMQNWQKLNLPDPNSQNPNDRSRWAAFAEKTLGGPGVNVSMSADKTGAEKLADKSVAGYDAAMEGARHANRSTTTYAQMARAAESFMPGASANIRLDAQRWLKDAGIIKGENVPAGEQLRMLGTRLAIESAPKGQGQVSNYERTMFKDALPQMTQSPEGFRQAVGMAQRLNEYEIAAAKIWQEEARAAPHGVPDYRNVQDKLMALGPPLTSDEVASLQSLSNKEAAGPQMPAAAPVTPAAPVRYRNPKTGETIELSPDGKSWVPVK